MPELENISIDDFNQRLKAQSAKLKIPFEATIELTYACNLRCLHCYNPTHLGSPSELSRPEIFSLIDQLAEAGCQLILFSGGEPFMRPDLFEVLDYTRSKGLQAVLNSNATLFSKEKLSALESLGLTLLSISVYGMTEATYESVTGIKGSFARFQEGLKLLKNYSLPILFKMPVMTLNQHELVDAKTFFREQNWNFIHTVEIHPRADGNLSPLNVRLSEDQAARLRVQYDELTRCGGYNRNSENGEKREHFLFDCQCGKNSLAITPFAEMNLCVSTPFPKYSLRTGNVREGWSALVSFVQNIRPSEKHECPTCELSPFCSQGSMDAFLNTGDFNPCLPYFKETASQVKHLLEEKNAR